ncbi:418b949d-3e01-4e51-93eb-c58dedf33451 [Sclerotinia trifoliorum]|uniref:418b949d-3e01-4e51-93eb-c58dedf33451 n=1 Tax=Sclerotinia trifoliorum TaxID=28548 RepID=A0A8H2VL70_9HELO|nr:418b949d-3e01-4e51-93eb-c58dedf33451 [Sclerotinia trifoliorum]
MSNELPTTATNGNGNGHGNNVSSTFTVKAGLARMLKGGVIMDVVNAEQARIAEEAGAVAVMALERVPADIRAQGGVARMSDPKMIREIMETVTIPVMAKARIGHFVECQILQSIGVDYIDESEVLTPADALHHVENTLHHPLRLRMSQSRRSPPPHLRRRSHDPHQRRSRHRRRHRSRPPPTPSNLRDPRRIAHVRRGTPHPSKGHPSTLRTSQRNRTIGTTPRGKLRCGRNRNPC